MSVRESLLKALANHTRVLPKGLDDERALMICEEDLHKLQAELGVPVGEVHDPKIAGIPLEIDDAVPEDEVWVVYKVWSATKPVFKRGPVEVVYPNLESYVESEN